MTESILNNDIKTSKNKNIISQNVLNTEKSNVYKKVFDEEKVFTNNNFEKSKSEKYSLQIIGYFDSISNYISNVLNFVSFKFKQIYNFIKIKFISEENIEI